MYLQAIPLSVIGDRAHGEKSINGVRAEEKGPKSKDELNDIVDTASQRGITVTCKEMKSAVPYSDHRMYKKLNIGTDIGKLKILPVNGGKFYSERFVGPGVEYPLPTESRANRLHGRLGEDVQLLLQQSPEAPHRTKRGVGEGYWQKENDIFRTQV